MSAVAPRQLVADIVAACHVASAQGLAGAYGHVSARIPGTGRFAISGRKSLAAMEADDVSDVPVECPEVSSPLIPIEVFIHSAVYATRPDVQAIVRVHSEACSVFGILAMPIRAVHALGATVSADVPVFASARLVVTADDGAAVAAALGESAAVVLRGNGVVVTGGSVREACVRAVYLEESARLQVQAAAFASRQPLYLTGPELASAVEHLTTPAQVERSWQHFTGLLRSNPGDAREM